MHTDRTRTSVIEEYTAVSPQHPSPPPHPSSTPPSTQSSSSFPSTRRTALTIQDVSAQVRTWLDEAALRPVPSSARMLSDLLRDPDGLEFALAFVDRVIRPEDPRAGAAELRRLAANPPAFLPPMLRRVVALGGTGSHLAPSAVIATARATMRKMVSHLILDARPRPLRRTIPALTADGTRLNLNLLGEAVLGAQEAARRLAGVWELLMREDVDYVSIKVSAVVDHLPPAAADETVAHTVETLLPMFLDASRTEQPPFINLDMEEYRDLEITLRVFEQLLDRPELRDFRAGIVLQAYLPDAPAAMRRLQDFARRRVEAGGAPIKVRLVKGANLPLEQVEAALHGWRQAPLFSKEETDAQYKRMLLDTLTPEALEAVHLGVAGHNLFDIAFAHLLMLERGIAREGRGGVEFEMLAGMAPAQQAVVQEATGTMRLYVPVVAPEQFDVAVSYLVRRLEEAAAPQNFLSAVFDLGTSPELFDREEARFSRALERALQGDSVPTHRDQDRSREGVDGPPELGSAVLPALPGRFRNTPDTDLSTAVNQDWAATISHRIRGSRLGIVEADAARLATPGEVAEVISRSLTAQPRWAGVGLEKRALVLRRVARLLAVHRAELLEVMAAETGKTIEEGDPEVSEAIDFALHYAEQADQLLAEKDLRCTPRALTLVTPPWNFPVAIPTGGVLAALVTGSAVIMKPAPQARRCGALLGSLMHRAGVPEDVLQIVDVPEDETGRALITDPRIDQLILTGAFETASLFASWRPELRILAETSGKNAIVVTPHADLDLAAKDVAQSAFGHAGQKCSAASLVILVGSAARSRRFSAQLADAVLSRQVGHPMDPTAQMGPIIEPPRAKLRSGLTELGPGERWLTAPKQLDDAGTLFTPGVRERVREGSEFHLTEYFGPVLGIMHADTLEDAVRMQNATAYGLTAGLHSLDPDEIAWWTQHVQAGNLYVNRGITGAVVQRQPFGGWKRSAVGPTAKAGGPNYLLTLMDVSDADGVPAGTPGATDMPPSDSTEPFADSSAEPPDSSAEPPDASAERSTGSSADPAAGATWLDRARASDRHHWATTFAARDIQQLHGEINLLRCLPLPVLVRCTAEADAATLERVLHAASTAGAPVEVSLDHATVQAAGSLDGDPGSTGNAPRTTAGGPGTRDEAAGATGGGVGARPGAHQLVGAVTRSGLSSEAIRWESTADLAQRLSELPQSRIRLLGTADATLRQALAANLEVALFDAPVTVSGRVELLPFLREQAISATNHRYGTPLPHPLDLNGGADWERGPTSP